MEQEPVQPLLFMRTVIQAIKALPKIKPHIFRTLRNLIGKSIWLDQSQWRGFLLLVADQGKPYYPIMLELPLPVLEQVMLNSMNAGDPFHGKAYSLATWALMSEYRPRMMATQVAIFERYKAAQEAEEAQLLAALGVLNEGQCQLNCCCTTCVEGIQMHCYAFVYSYILCLGLFCLFCCFNHAHVVSCWTVTRVFAQVAFLSC